MVFYTDGGCSPNPGEGAYAIIQISDDNSVSYKTEYFENTTNNRMEMLAILNVLKEYNGAIVYTDSSYALNTFTTWMYKWAEQGWRRPRNQPVENLDIVQEYYDLIQSGRSITLYKVRGHDGVEYNELADSLVKRSIREKGSIYGVRETDTRAD